MRKLLVALAVLAAVLLPGTPALAHNALVSAKPAKNATVAKAPAEVTLGFLQKLNPKFTTIVVSDAEKQKIPAADPAIKGPKVTLKLDEPLPNGAYTVAYRVVSTDGHTVEGSYKFTVADKSAPTAAPAPSATSPSAAPAVSVAPSAGPTAGVLAASTDSSGPGAGVIVLTTAVIILAAGLIGWFVVRRRRAPSA
jgi:methionine-rich copper-binding protein CopC